jgi:putative toxin-antitoxin system antitoxin component (TIGR02293 family)
MSKKNGKKFKFQKMSCIFGNISKEDVMALKKQSKMNGAGTDSENFVSEAAVDYLAASTPNSYLGIAGGSIYSPNDQESKLRLIRGGLHRASLDVLMKRTGLSIYELADILELTDRTLRRYEPNDVLNRRLSERALEIAELYSRGEEVFGSAASFRKWMEGIVPALGHCSPKSFLDTSIGIQMLMDELGRIEHGVFA